MNRIDLETVGIGLEHVKNVLNVFDDRVSEELAVACGESRDPYAHYFADRYEVLRSLLLVSLDIIGRIIEACDPCSEQALDAATDGEE